MRSGAVIIVMAAAYQATFVVGGGYRKNDGSGGINGNRKWQLLRRDDE